MIPGNGLVCHVTYGTEGWSDVDGSALEKRG